MVHLHFFRLEETDPSYHLDVVLVVIGGLGTVTHHPSPSCTTSPPWERPCHRLKECSAQCCVPLCKSWTVTSQHANWQPEPLWGLLPVTDLRGRIPCQPKWWAIHTEGICVTAYRVSSWQRLLVRMTCLCSQKNSLYINFCPLWPEACVNPRWSSILRLQTLTRQLYRRVTAAAYVILLGS